MLGLGLALRQRGAFSLRMLFADGEAGAWYDPSDPATLFADGGGTVQAVVDGPVGRIADKSGRGNHLTQGVAASRPTLRRDSGGRLYLEFDGVDDFMSSPAIGAPTRWTAVAALRQAAGDGFGDVWNDRGPNIGLRLNVNEATGIGAAVGDGTATLQSTTSGSAIGVNVVACARYDGTSATAYRNGIAAAPAAALLSPGAAAWTLGRANEFAGNHFTGRVYGLVSIHRVLGEAERRGAERWLAARAGVAAQAGA